MKNSTQLKADLYLNFFSLAKKQVAGFSLIELSLTLIVVASLALIAMTKMVEENEIDRKIIVLDDLDKIKKAIQSFADRNGYYPCPAKPGFSVTDADFAVSATIGDGMRTEEYQFNPSCGRYLDSGYSGNDPRLQRMIDSKKIQFDD